MAVTERYEVEHDGSLFLYVDHHGLRGASELTATRGAVTTPLTATPLAGWYSVEGTEPVDSVSGEVLVRGATTGYVLVDPEMESVRLPLRLTVSELEDLDEDDEDGWSSSVARHYRSEVAPDRTETVTVDVSGARRLAADPTALAPAGTAWVASLPTVLSERREYAHLFSGHLEGVTALVEHALKTRVPGVRYVFAGRVGTRSVPTGSLEVHRDLLFEDERTREVVSQRTPRSKKVRSVVPATVTSTFLVDAPTRVAGSSLAEAVAELERVVEAAVATAGGRVVRACATCDGTGRVVHEV